MLGMVEGNGHPYSWSAIVNGDFDSDRMKRCPYPVIPDYLEANRAELGIPGATVTHIWTDDPADAEDVAKCSLIEHVVDNPEDVIGKVDAVCIATDIGHEHVTRAQPFIDAGVPTFIDKPLTDNRDDLLTFIDCYEKGSPLLSTSAMRYAPEVQQLKALDIGEPRLASSFTPKSWARYGIHAMEALYPLTGPGFVSVRNLGDETHNTVVIKHRKMDVTVWAISDAYGGFGSLQWIGTKGFGQVKCTDTFHAFKRQLEVFIEFVRTGKQPFAPAETFELIAVIVAGIESRRQNGGEVRLSDILPEEYVP